MTKLTPNYARIDLCHKCLTTDHSDSFVADSGCECGLTGKHLHCPECGRYQKHVSQPDQPDTFPAEGDSFQPTLW